MFDRIVVNIMQVVLQIMIIPYYMIPKSPLPEFHRFRGRKYKLLFLFERKVWFERMHDVTEITFSGWLNNHVDMVE